MKFIMVVIICWTAEFCEGIWEQKFYETKAECDAEAVTVKDYMMLSYPTTSGQIYCMSEKDFQQYYEQLQNGGSIQPSGTDA